MFEQHFSPSITSTKAIKKLINLYAKTDNWHNLNPEQGDLGYGWLHYAYIRNLKPNRVLCIGSRYGFIPAVCALACKDNQHGVVDFVDAGYDQRKNDLNHWGGVGLWKKIDKNTYFKPYGLKDYVHLFVTTSKDFARQHPKQTYQYIHLDGDHSYEGVKQDFALFWPTLKTGGFICFHDIYTQDLGDLHYGVNKFWRETKKKYGGIELPGPCGLGLIQK